jgi:hypothetical protein
MFPRFGNDDWDVEGGNVPVSQSRCLLRAKRLAALLNYYLGSSSQLPVEGIRMGGWWQPRYL